MAIQDSDPERRNLVVTSLAFIIFYAADGQVSQDAIRLQIIPVTFDDIETLRSFAWILLLWFGLRYWQTHRQSYKSAYHSYMTEFDKNKGISQKYIERCLKITPFNEDNGFRENRVFWRGPNIKMFIEYKIVEDFTRNPDGGISIGKQTQKELAISGKWAAWVKCRYFISFVINSTGFTSYAIPYVLFALALSSPALKAYGHF